MLLLLVQPNTFSSDLDVPFNAIFLPGFLIFIFFSSDLTVFFLDFMAVIEEDILKVKPPLILPVTGCRNLFSKNHSAVVYWPVDEYLFPHLFSSGKQTLLKYNR